MGSEALARGILESGATMATAYPGTPSSEIMAAIQAMSRAGNYPIHAEWSINEKVAYETALAHAYCGGRAAVSMKQVGLNVAADPFMSSPISASRADSSSSRPTTPARTVPRPSRTAA